jgi:hypothetical protein
VACVRLLPTCANLCRVRLREAWSRRQGPDWDPREARLNLLAMAATAHVDALTPNSPCTAPQPPSPKNSGGVVAVVPSL